MRHPGGGRAILELVEVGAGHVGMATDVEVLRTVADRLGAITSAPSQAPASLR